MGLHESNPWPDEAKLVLIEYRLIKKIPFFMEN
jgi:hypothetical protein